MKANEMKMPELHKLYNEWISKLNFYKDELTSLQKRNEEIASKYNTTDVMAQVEHFQNQFIIQHNEMDILTHDIKIEEQELQKNFNDNPTAWDHRKTEHGNIQDRMDAFEKIFNDMHAELKAFAAKYL
jgi:hypothetical protein